MLVSRVSNYILFGLSYFDASLMKMNMYRKLFDFKGVEIVFCPKLLLKNKTL